MARVMQMELQLMQTEGSIIQHPPDASVKQLLR